MTGNKTPDSAEPTSAGQIEQLAQTLVALPYETWNFGDSVAFEALIEASDSLGNERWAAFAHGWSRSWATRALPRRRLDCTAPGLAMVHLASRFGDKLLLQAAVDLADYLLTRPKLHGVYETWESSPLMMPYGPVTLDAEGAALVENAPPGVFLDCLHFDPPYFAALARATGEQRYAREAIDQALGYISLLQREDGLFEHFVLRGNEGTFGPGWGRGQGWALLGLLDVLKEFEGMPMDQGGAYAADLELIRASAARLVLIQLELQREDGHWYAVVDNPESGDEYSTAAFMAAGFVRALELGVTTDPRVEPAAAAATRAVERGLDDAGKLAEVSAAVMACTEPSHYAHVPRGFEVPWGQGPALLAIAAWSRWVGRERR